MLLSDLVTIAVSPRERHYCLIPSLLSIFATVPDEVRVIVAQGDIPDDLYQSLKDLKNLRNFELIHPKYPLYPQEARNLCIEITTTEFIVIADNDVEYEDGWLEAFVENAISTNSDIVAPVIFIGPPKNKIIHHAGGLLKAANNINGNLVVTETHRLANKDISDVDVNILGENPDTIEFHCFLARISYLNISGLLDERLITQEQVDFGLRTKALQGKVSFEPKVRVTYMAKKVFSSKDLDYLSFRWNDIQAVESMQVIQNSWGISFDISRRIANWIRPHRVRAYQTRYQDQFDSLGPESFFRDFMQPLEISARDRALKLRNGKALQGATALSDEIKKNTLLYFSNINQVGDINSIASIEIALCKALNANAVCGFSEVEYKGRNMIVFAIETSVVISREELIKATSGLIKNIGNISFVVVSEFPRIATNYFIIDRIKLRSIIQKKISMKN